MHKTQASFEIYWPPDASEYLLKLALIAKHEHTIPASGPLREDYDLLIAGYEGSYPEFNVVICTEESGQLWFYGNEAFDPGFVAHLIQLVMRRFNIERPVAFQWANTHSNARPNSFGGGAFVITQASTSFTTTYMWIVDELAKLMEENDG